MDGPVGVEDQLDAEGGQLGEEVDRVAVPAADGRVEEEPGVEADPERAGPARRQASRTPSPTSRRWRPRRRSSFGAQPIRDLGVARRRPGGGRARRGGPCAGSVSTGSGLPRIEPIMSMTSCIDRAAPVATLAVGQPRRDGERHVDDGAGRLVDRDEVAPRPEVAEAEGLAGPVADLLDQLGEEVGVRLAGAVEVEEAADDEVGVGPLARFERDEPLALRLRQPVDVERRGRFLLAVGRLGRGVDVAGRGEPEPLDPGGAAGREDRLRAEDVDPDGQGRVGDAGRDVVQGREVDDGGGAERARGASGCAAGSRRSATTKVQSGFLKLGARKSSRPHWRLSSATTGVPRPRMSSTTCEPRNPAAPVTSQGRRSAPVVALIGASPACARKSIRWRRPSAPARSATRSGPAPRDAGGPGASGSSRRATVRSIRPASSSQTPAWTPSTAGRPSTPSLVVTTGTPVAIASRILIFIPLPAARGVDHDGRPLEVGADVGDVLEDLDAGRLQELRQRRAGRPADDLERGLGDAPA